MMHLLGDSVGHAIKSEASLEPADIEGLTETFVFLCGQQGAAAALVAQNAFVRSLDLFFFYLTFL